MNLLLVCCLDCSWTLLQDISLQALLDLTWLLLFDFWAIRSLREVWYEPWIQIQNLLLIKCFVKLCILLGCSLLQRCWSCVSSFYVNCLEEESFHFSLQWGSSLSVPGVDACEVEEANARLVCHCRMTTFWKSVTFSVPNGQTLTLP